MNRAKHNKRPRYPPLKRLESRAAAGGMRSQEGEHSQDAERVVARHHGVLKREIPTKAPACRHKYRKGALKDEYRYGRPNENKRKRLLRREGKPEARERFQQKIPPYRSSHIGGYSHDRSEARVSRHKPRINLIPPGLMMQGEDGCEDHV